MLTTDINVRNTLIKCDEKLKCHSKVMSREFTSPTYYPKVSLDKKTIDSLLESQVPLDVGESGRNVSPPRITPEIIGSVGAQLELLRHELFLAKKQVKERNRQIIKLERIINHQKVELKHSCEGSSNLMKIMELLYGAVDVQNNQLENMRNIKERLFSLEGSQFCLHKPMNAERIKKNCGSLPSTNLPEPGDPPVVNRCIHVCDCDSQTVIKATQNPNISPQPTVSSTGSKAMKIHKTTVAENNCKVSHAFDSSHSNESLEELEKQRMINCQLNEYLMKLQEEVKVLKFKIEKCEENEVSALRSSSSFEKEKQSLLEQLSILTRQNGKLQGHISQIDTERDKAVRELDSSDEMISKMEIEVQRANSEARRLDCQWRTAAERCRRLEQLLENSEKITASLKKQKTHLEKQVDRARSETEVIQKSFQVLRNKYKKTCNNFHLYKRKMLEANAEKVILQSQIQEYVSRVRHIEDLLLQKEQEREFVFQQFQEITAKDNCRNSFLDETDNRESPPAANTPHTLSDPVCLANAETQTTTLKETGAGDSCYGMSKDFLQELAHETKPLSKGNEAINTTQLDPTSKKEQFTNKLDIMGRTVNRLESQVKIIGKSFGNCQKKCISQEERSSRRYSAESSLSTML